MESLPNNDDQSDVMAGLLGLAPTPSTEPTALYRHNVVFSGLPTVTALAIVGGLLNLYQVKNDFVPEGELNTESVVTGDDRLDELNTSVYFDLKNILDAYAREYIRIEAVGQIYGTVIMITFKCW